MTDFRSMSWPFQTAHIAARFKQYRRLMDHWRTVLPGPIHEVDYEATVNDLEGVARRLVELCGLEWEPACLEFHRNKRPVRTASLIQVRRPVYTSSVGRWKNYESELASLFEALAEGLMLGGEPHPSVAFLVSSSSRHDCANRFIRLRNVVSSSAAAGAGPARLRPRAAPGRTRSAGPASATPRPHG